MRVDIKPWEEFEFTKDVCGCLVQYPDTHGELHNIDSLVSSAHAAGVSGN